LRGNGPPDATASHDLSQMLIETFRTAIYRLYTPIGNRIELQPGEKRAEFWAGILAGQGGFRAGEVWRLGAGAFGPICGPHCRYPFDFSGVAPATGLFKAKESGFCGQLCEGNV
jgi:hypothetical protein